MAKSSGAKAVYRMNGLARLRGPDRSTRSQVTRVSNLEIGEATPFLAKLFKEAKFNKKQIKRQEDRVLIAATLGERSFKIELNPYTDRGCHLKINELGPQSKGFKVENTYIRHHNQAAIDDSQEGPLVAQLRTEIDKLTENYVPLKKPGLTIDGHSRKMAELLSSDTVTVTNPELQRKTHRKRKKEFTKVVKVEEPKAKSKADADFTLKLFNPDGNNGAKLIATDHFGNMLLHAVDVKVKRSTDHKEDRNPVVKAVSKAVTRINRDYKEAMAA